MNLHTKLIGISILACLALPNVALAKTFYVQQFGDDEGGANVTCSKSAPCASITHVLDIVAGDRDRVLVGPGTYDGSLYISQPSLKLTSVAGAHATTIVSDPGHGVTIDTEKVTFGQKRRGFTVIGDPMDSFGGENGILVLGDKARVEGNRIIGPDADIEDNTNSGILVPDDHVRGTFRYNTIVNFQNGINLYSTIDPPRHNVSDNRVTNAPSSCIVAEAGSAANSRMKFANNILDGCGTNGIYIFFNGTEKSGDQIKGNVITDVVNRGIRLYGGTPKVTKNLIRDGDYGFWIDFTQSAQIKDNLIQNIANSAIHMGSDPMDVDFSGNTMEGIGGGTGAVEMASGSEDFPFRKFSKNNLLNLDGGGCPIGFANPPTGEWEMKGNFWGDLNDLDGVPDLSCNTNANTALGNETLTLAPATRPNPVKFKSPF